MKINISKSIKEILKKTRRVKVGEEAFKTQSKKRDEKLKSFCLNRDSGKLSIYNEKLNINLRTNNSYHLTIMNQMAR